MRKFLLFWKYDHLELSLQKQSVLCDWLLTLITFVASLGIVDALFTSRFTKKIAAVKPVPHSDHLVPEVAGGGITGFYDLEKNKVFSVGELSGNSEITIKFGFIFFIGVGLVLLGLLLWKFKIITRQYELKKMA
ncbi:hypothetical protein [Leuconostoc lactis]|uniref:hypothetical protein n=1 Tax=Leuconostoc lactis TaxID=1246 RepID=UPI000EBE9FCA|nr:hypothetical protein [Leuconostoc lactis]HCH60026.1 hypothetical protein [Leuconostoc lactis]